VTLNKASDYFKMFPRVSYWNCGSGFIGKSQLIDDYINDHKIDCFFVAEADILQNRCLLTFRVPNMVFETTKTINRGKSRLGCWYNPTLFTRSLELEHTNNEIIVLKHKEFLIAGLYRPFKCYPGENLASNFERLRHNVESLCSITKNIVVIGDLNVNWRDHNKGPFKAALEDTLERFNLVQLVECDTRHRVVQGVLQKSCLDLVITNLVNVQVDGVFNDKSDHIILNVAPLQKSNQQRQRTQVTFLDWRWYNQYLMKEGFENLFRGYNRLLTNTNLINNRITSAICEVLNILVPKRTVMLLSVDSVTNPLIQTLKNRKIRAFKKWKRSNDIVDFDRLKSISRKLNYEIKKRKRKNLALSVVKDRKNSGLA